MPDQSSASSEHALIQEITAPLATLPDDAVPQISDVEFPVVLRGYDRVAVDTYVRKTSQLVAELQATRSPEAAVRRALERVGEEVSGILQRAHDTAQSITANSRRDAEDRLEAARVEAEQITAAAEARVKELDAEIDRIWAERHRIVEDTRELARQLVGLAESAAERFPAEELVPEAPAPDGTEVTAAFPASLHGDDEDATQVAFRAPEPAAAEPAAAGEELDWGAAGEWHAEPGMLAEPPEFTERTERTEPTVAHSDASGTGSGAPGEHDSDAPGASPPSSEPDAPAAPQ
jgi:cell division septum initiation protein DivIVA